FNLITRKVSRDSYSLAWPSWEGAMRRAVLLFALVLTVVGGTLSASAAKRVALVIGIDAYDNLPTLQKAVNDEKEPEAVVAECQAATVVTPAHSFRNLLTNARVERLIKFKLHKRGVPYPSTMLGPQDASLTIVADYDELCGHTVADAVRLLGYKIQPGDAVTAIAFPRAPWRITPAGALGLLQIVAAAEAGLDSGKKRAIEQALSPAAVKGLTLGEERPPLEVWAWSAYAPYYPEYCQLALKFRCDPSYAAAAKFGAFDHSWHPLGFAEQTKMLNDLCTEEAEAKLCRIANAQTAWPELKPYYGARIFLIENAPLSAVAGKVVIDFEAPEA